ncbi:MAG: terminase family protein [Clostridia bacterium]|nr:terminase family protein [Clostridia bacterium]
MATITRNSQTESQVKQDKADRIMNGVNVWAAFYRANPHRFARDYLNLKLDRFQQIILCMMFRFSNVVYLASRGGGKSFLIAIFCVIHCILYPETRICLASKTRKQATEIIDKIREILMPRSANLRLEIEEVQVNQANAFVSFRNDSRIVVVTAADSARHNRATVLVVDEFRMVDKNIIDTVLRKFLTSQRHPAFLDKPEYKDYPKEQTKELYASSCWYESHWSYELVRSYVVNMIRGRSYFCCAMPYQLAIKEGRLDKTKVEDEMSETTFNAITFQMEMEALFFGQSSGGLYNFDEIDRNRVIKYPFYPKFAGHKIADKRLYIPPKIPGEVRVLSADIALMSSTKNKNDATSIFVNQMLPTSNNRFVNNIVYADNNEGLRTDAQALVIRKLFEDYDCDYLVLDTKGLGLGVSDALMADIYDQESGTTYGALSCCNNDELAKRCLVPDAPKVIWSVQGTQEFNSQCALGLREALKQGSVRLLTSEFAAEDSLGELRGYDNLSTADALNLKLPYIHTSLLINELIKLEYEVRNNVIRVKEKAGMRKDRYSSLSYNIHVAKIIERDLQVQKSKKTMEQLVFKFRAPQIKKKY